MAHFLGWAQGTIIKSVNEVRGVKVSEAARDEEVAAETRIG